MKKTVRFLVVLVLFMGITFGSFLIFFPWEAAGHLGAALVQQEMTARGVTCSWENLESPGAGAYRVASLSLALPLGKVSVNDCQAKLLWGASLFQRAPVVAFDFGAGNLEAFGTELSWKKGAGKIACKNNVLTLSSFRMGGDFSAQGERAFSLDTFKFITASIPMRIPKDREKLFRSLKILLPLRQGSEAGQWFLERKEGASK